MPKATCSQCGSTTIEVLCPGEGNPFLRCFNCGHENTRCLVPEILRKIPWTYFGRKGSRLVYQNVHFSLLFTKSAAGKERTRSLSWRRFAGEPEPLVFELGKDEATDQELWRFCVAYNKAMKAMRE